MATVRHRVGIKGDAGNVFQALIQPEKLTGWWASGAIGTPAENETLTLDFTGLTQLVFRFRKIVADRCVALTCSGRPEIWNGSTLEFELQADDRQVHVTLVHAKPEASDDEFLYFNTKWPLFLVSLKDYIETGSGRPYPNDIRINHDI